jgi:hypothetical protein
MKPPLSIPKPKPVQKVVANPLAKAQAPAARPAPSGAIGAPSKSNC